MLTADNTRFPWLRELIRIPTVLLIHMSSHFNGVYYFTNLTNDLHIAMICTRALLRRSQVYAGGKTINAQLMFPKLNRQIKSIETHSSLSLLVWTRTGFNTHSEIQTVLQVMCMMRVARIPREGTQVGLEVSMTVLEIINHQDLGAHNIDIWTL